MANKRTKIHHYVPQALQKYFCDKNDQLWFSERSGNGEFGDPELRNRSSTFKLRDYYTILEDGKLSDRIERDFYGVIDNFLGQFLEKVHAAFDRGLTPEVSGEALLSIRRVTYHMIARVPQFIKDVDEYKIGKSLVEKTIERAISEKIPHEEIDALRLELQDKSHLRKLGRSIRVKGQAKPTKEVLRRLDSLDLRYAICDGGGSFILPSVGAYRNGNGGPNGLANPDMEIWFPISPKRALVFLTDPRGKIPLVVPTDRNQLREVNEYGAAQSNQIASHSLKLIKSLV